MIRKIPNKNWWILRYKDMSILLNTCRYSLLTYARLPLFSTTLTFLNYEDDVKDDELILAMDFSEDTMSEQNIEVVNKRWNEFYD